jgi:hypothetical protein
MLEQVRTYQELIDCVALCRHVRGVDAKITQDREPVLTVRIVPAAGHRTGDLWRVCAFTPYDTQTIVEDALCAGPGARLEVSVPPNASDPASRRLDDQLAGLLARSIQVSIRREQYPSTTRESSSR